MLRFGVIFPLEKRSGRASGWSSDTFSNHYKTFSDLAASAEQRALVPPSEHSSSLLQSKEYTACRITSTVLSKDNLPHERKDPMSEHFCQATVIKWVRGILILYPCLTVGVNLGSHQHGWTLRESSWWTIFPEWCACRKKSSRIRSLLPSRALLLPIRPLPWSAVIPCYEYHP